MPATVRRLGWLHFANDLTLDFLTPLLPAGVPVAWLGVMEGVADGVAQVLKLVTGRAADRSGRRAPWVAAGYAGNAFFRPLAGVGMLLGWPLWIVTCRIGDRLGKGLRSAASDALIADWVLDAESRARAYARMRTYDHVGATVGALAAAAAVAVYSSATQIGWMICGLVVPAVAMLWWCRGLRDAPRAQEIAPVAGPVAGSVAGPVAGPVGWWPADLMTRRLLWVIALAGIGARIGPLLILAHVAGLGVDATVSWPLWQVCLAWAALAVVQALAAMAAGWATARWGALPFLRLGWVIGAAAYGALAFSHGAALLVAGLAWGLVTGLTEGAEKTAVAALAPKLERATAFGALGLLCAGAALLGSGLVGVGLAHVGGIIFAVPGAALLLSALLSAAILRRPLAAR